MLKRDLRDSTEPEEARRYYFLYSLWIRSFSFGRQ
jgi:hypothetical protein